MEKKEYQLDIINKGDLLEVYDPDGNPFSPSDPVKYQILGEDDNVLKEGELQNTNIIPLSDINTDNFKVVIEDYFVIEVKGLDSQDEPEGPAEAPDELVMPLHESDLEDPFGESEETDTADEDSEQTDQTSSDDSQKENQADEEVQGSDDSTDSDSGESSDQAEGSGDNENDSDSNKQDGDETDTDDDAEKSDSEEDQSSNEDDDSNNDTDTNDDADSNDDSEDSEK